MLFSVIPGISLIWPPGKGKFPYSYSVLIENDQVTALIDTSFGEENLAQLQERGIDLIINTHFHRDHIMYNHRFPEVEIWAHYLDAPCIRSLDTFIDAYGCHLFGGEEIARQYFKNANIVPSPVHRELRDGELLTLGTTRLQVVHTPGHTPGHCAFWEEKHGILISGDIDLAGFGPWYAHYCSNLDDFLSSIDLCREINPRILLSGHKGLISQDIDAGLNAFRDVILRKEEQVLQALSIPHSLDDLAAYQIFYGKNAKLPPMYQWFEKLAMHQHLKRLKRMGLISESEGIYQRS